MKSVKVWCEFPCQPIYCQRNFWFQCSKAKQLASFSSRTWNGIRSLLQIGIGNIWCRNKKSRFHHLDENIAITNIQETLSQSCFTIGMVKIFSPKLRVSGVPELWHPRTRNFEIQEVVSDFGDITSNYDLTWIRRSRKEWNRFWFLIILMLLILMARRKSFWEQLLGWVVRIDFSESSIALVVHLVLLCLSSFSF